MSSTQKIHRSFTGVVVSDKMEKTIVVRVERTVIHPKYGKRYMRSKKYHVHDENKSHKVGDVVKFEECSPYSKTKRWRIVESRGL